MNAVCPAQPEKGTSNNRGVKLLLAIVFGFLGISVTVHAVALSYVFSTQTDLVRSDYYEAGQSYDQEIALKAAGATKPFDIRLTADTVRVRLAHAEAGTLAAVGRIQLYRPGDAALDRKLALPRAVVKDGVATWLVDAKDLAPGRWRVRLELDARPPLAVEVDRDVKP